MRWQHYVYEPFVIEREGFDYLEKIRNEYEWRASLSKVDREYYRKAAEAIRKLIEQ